MSFWPFGQNVNNSNINRLLDDYFRVLHSLAEEGADQTGGVSEPIAAGAGGGVKVEGMQVRSQGRGSTIKGDFSTEGGNTERQRAESSQKYNAAEASSEIGVQGKGNGEPSEVEPFVSTISILSTASSAVSIFVDDAGNCNTPAPPLSKKWLNSSFMDNILKESELLNELTRQNNTLLDFICFGYFYDVNGKRIEHVEYLIDQLMFCIDRINEDKPLVDGAGKESLQNHEESSNRNILKYNEHGISIPPACGDLSMDSMPPDNDAEIIPFINDSHMYNNQSTYLNRANTISEIFALDNWLISETLVKDFAHLKKIWSVLFHQDFKAEKSPLVPIFLKVNQNLLLTRQDQFLNFIRSRTTLVDDLLLHLEIPVLMNFFLKIISTDKQESPTGIIELTYEQGLITKLLSYLDNQRCTADIQACAGDFIKALIAISTNAPLDEMSIGPNALIRRLCSEECIRCFMDAIINKRGSALTTSVSVVIELIRKNNSDYDQVNLLSTTIKTHPPSMRDPIYLGTMLKMFAESLPDLKKVLLDFEENTASHVIENQLGIEYVPLGFERFKIVELIAELLHCSNMGLMNSKKAERIVKERDEVRKHLVMQLRDALTDLSIDDNIDRERNDINEQPGTSVNNDSPITQTTAVSDQVYDDIDESFEIPYVNKNQNMKLRQNPTIGDAFKIQLYDTQILPKIIQLFIDHPWNNFWHNVIFDIIQQIFNGRMDFSYNSFLVYSLFNNRDAGQFSTGSGVDLSDSEGKHNFVDFQVTRDLILQGYKNSHNFYEKYNTNLGYMGHLVLIAEEIVKFSKVYKVELISPDIHNALQDPDWVFYSEDALNDTRLMYSKILGGGDYLDDTQDSALNENSGMLNTVGSGDFLNINDGQQPSYTFSTQADLHKKLKEKLIKKSQEEIDIKNKENGVIILGPPPESFKFNDQPNV